MTKEQQLILEAIPCMFRACGNSYINAWLQDWLERARTERASRPMALSMCRVLSKIGSRRKERINIAGC